MSRKRTENGSESGPATSHVPVDRFGFLKQEHANSPERFSKSKTTSSTDHDRYVLRERIILKEYD
jgi:hypothetical protein